MTTKMAKTATVATVALGLVAIMLAYSAFVTPASAQTDSNNSTASSTTSSGSPTTISSPGQGGYMQGPGGPGGPFAGAFRGGPGRDGGGPLALASAPTLTVGQTFTVTSSSGEYYVVGNSSTNGTASGSVTFTVTGKLAGGYTVSISSGSLSVAGTTYTISSGSAQMGRDAASLVGQGATTPSGEFLIRASAHGSFAGTTSTLSLDLSSGSTEYLVFLAGSISS